MEIIGHITSFSNDENTFSIKDTQKIYKCEHFYDFFPIKKKDKIKAIIYKNGSIYNFKNRPLILIPRGYDILNEYFLSAYKGKVNYSKIHEIIEDLKIKYDEDIDGVYDHIVSDSFSTPLGISKKIILDWWNKNVLKRQLWLWGFNNNEFNYFLDNEELWNFIKKMQKNTYTNNKLTLEKATEMEKMFGRKTDEKRKKRAKIYRNVCKNVEINKNKLMEYYPDLGDHISKLENSYELIFEDNYVYQKDFYDIDNFLLENVNKWIKYNNDYNFKINVKTIGIQLTNEQEIALKGMLNNYVSIVTGGAGCGKTTLIKQLIYNLKQYDQNIMLTSFTGKAVLRMKEILDDDKTCCYTMSKIIKCKKIIKPFSHVIIDESSMISNDIMAKFLKFFPSTKIYFIGDCNQLPPVGRGNFFYQLIESNKIPCYKLTLNKRINKDCNTILQNANQLISNDIINFKYDKVFKFYEGDINICEKILKILKKKNYNSNDITILTPCNKHIKNLVNIQQNIFLNQSNYKIHNGIKYYIGDRIMQNKNIYNEEVEIMNGEEGIVKNLGKYSMCVKYNDKEVEYLWRNEKINTEEDIYVKVITVDYLNHSFCKTIHKSQGSEYPIVIIYIPDYYLKMVNRNLLYTAITRAQKMVIIVGDKMKLYEGCNRKLDFSSNRLSRKIHSL